VPALESDGVNSRISARRVRDAIGRRVRRLVEPLASATDEVGLAHRLLAPINRDGVMVDVGAHHGTSLREFATSGAIVFAFEPDTNNRSVLVRDFGMFPNVTIDDRAVTDQDVDALPFFTSPSSTGISGLVAFHPDHVQAATVRGVALRTYLADRAVARVDLLKIDTEGYDLFVLKGFPWNRLRPRVVICEFEDRKTKPLGYSFLDMANYLTGLGYSILISEWYPIVRYGGQHRWRRFVDLSVSSNHHQRLLADENAWGNFVACRDSADFTRLKRIARRRSMWYHLGRWIGTLMLRR
jgi:FkbM family methyltransferase